MLPRRVLLVLPLLAPGLAAQQATVQKDAAGPVLELTLEDALRIALERNLDLDLESLNTDIARYNSLGSWGAFDPVISLTGALTDSEAQGSSGLSGGTVVESDTQSLFGDLFVPFTTGGAFDLTYGRDNTHTNNAFALFDTSTTDVVTAALTQPLLRHGWRRYATSLQRESELLFAEQEAFNEEVRQRVLRDVANAYWDLVGSRDLLGVREVALQTGQQQLDQSRRRLELDVGTEVDVLQAETNVAQLEQQRLLAESNLRAAEDGLRRLLFQRIEGDPSGEAQTWDWPIDPLTPLPEVAENLAPEWMKSLERALRQRPELTRQRLEIEASDVRLDRAKSSKLPALDLGLQASSAGFDEEPTDAFDTAVGFDFPTYTGSLTFSVPIGNRTAKYAERSARAAVRASRVVYDQVELNVLAEVRAAVRDLLYAAAAVGAAQKSSEFAERQLAAEQARFREGLSTTFQVLEFQRDLVTARSTLTIARAQYAKAVVSLQHAEGELLGPDDAEDLPEAGVVVPP